MDWERISILKWAISPILTGYLGIALLNPSLASFNAAASGAAAPRDAAAIFQAKCAICHGEDGRGTDFGKEKGAPDFTQTRWQQSRTDKQINEAITNGKGKFMPAWKDRLSAEEIAALVAQVRAFGRKK